MILAWRIIYATDAHSHNCAPGDAAESQYMSLIIIKKQSGARALVPADCDPA